MENGLGLLEGIGRGEMNRIVMGKLRMDINLLEGTKELAIKEKVQTEIILSAVWGFEKSNLQESQNSFARAQGRNPPPALS